MKNIKKLTAAVLAAAMMVVFAGCGGDQSWSYKTDTASLTAGTYIYNMLNAYYEAYGMVESPDQVKSVLKEEVTDSDGNTKTVEQFSYDGADDECYRMLAVEELMKELNLEIDKEELDAAASYASQFWANVKDQFEEYGISQNSFNYCYSEYTVKFGQVFETVYGENGEKAVSDDEMIKYFKDKYTGYAYFGVSMATTNDEGESVAKSDEEFKKTEDDLNGYISAINDGSKTYKQAVAQYVEDYDLTSDPTYSGAVDLNDTTLNKDVANALKTMEEGKASLVKTGEGATTYYYLVYKPEIDSLIDFLDEDSDSDTDSLNSTASVATGDTAATSDSASASVYIYDLKSGYTHYTLLNEMKGDEYRDYLLEYGKNLQPLKNNDVVGRYKPSMFTSAT